MRKLQGVIILIRPVTILTGEFVTIVGTIVADNNAWLEAIASALVVGFVMAGGNAINDAIDHKIDLVNAPHRPIPQGIFTPGQVSALASVFFGIGLFVSLVCFGSDATAFVAVVILLLVLYAVMFKCTPLISNVIVAGVSSVAPLFGAFVVGNMSAVIWLALVVFFGVLTRELVKDLIDIEGDQKMDCQKTAVVFGELATQKITAVFYLCTAVVLLGGFWIQWQDFLLLALVPLFVAMVSMTFAMNGGHDQYKVANKVLKASQFIYLACVLYAELGVG